MDYREEIINSLVEVCKKARSEGFDSAREIYTKQVDSGYKKGLEDAWKCAKKVVLQYVEGGLKIDVFKKIFGESTYQSVLRNYTASEAMQKIKEYEERQKDDEKSCGTCKHVMRIDCGAYPCNECPRDTLPKWTPKQDEKCEKCTKEISAECVVDGCEFEPKQTDATDIDIGSIKIGDEIVDGQGRKVIVTQLSKLDGKDILKGFDGEGCPWNAIISNIWYKTGRHFPQIAEVLELLEG